MYGEIVTVLLAPAISEIHFYCICMALSFQSSSFFSYPAFHLPRPRTRCLRRPTVRVVLKNNGENGNMEVPLQDESSLRETLKTRADRRRAGLRVAAAIIAVSGGTLLVREGLLLYFIAVASMVCTQVGFELDTCGELYIRRRRYMYINKLRRIKARYKAVEVRETGDGRGRGVFAVRPIPKYSLLGFYEGVLLDTAQFITKYQLLDKRPEYAISVDSNYVIDGSDIANSPSTKTTFTPAHLNHTSEPKHINVGRVHQWRKRMVMFYTTRTVKKGEELRFDYGRDYWRGRESDLQK